MTGRGFAAPPLSGPAPVANLQARYDDGEGFTGPVVARRRSGVTTAGHSLS